jgi:hypothetical protein
LLIKSCSDTFRNIQRKELCLSVQQISKENLKNYYDTEQAEDELFNMLQSNRLYMMKDRTLDFIKQISGKSGDSYNIRETGKFLSDLINELKIKYEIKE